MVKLIKIYYQGMGTTRSTTTTTRRTSATKFNMNTISANNGGDSTDKTNNDEKCYFTGLVADKTNCESIFNLTG